MIGIGCWERMGGQVSYSSWLKAFMAENPQYATTIALGNQAGKTACGAALLDAAWKARIERNCGELDGAIRDMFGLAASFTPANEEEEEHRNLCADNDVAYIEWMNAAAREQQKEKDMSKETEQKQHDLNELEDRMGRMRERASRLRKERAEEWPKWHHKEMWTDCLVVREHADSYVCYEKDGRTITQNKKLSNAFRGPITKAQADKLLAKRDKRLAEEKLEAERKKNGERCVVVAVGMDGYLEVVRNGVHYALCEVVSFADFAGFEYADGSVRNVSLVWKIGSAFYDTNPRADDAYRVACHRPIAVLFK